MSALQRHLTKRYASGALDYGALEVVWNSAVVRGDRREAPCPLCSPFKGGASAHRRVMGLWKTVEGAIGYNCLRCGLKGRAMDNQTYRAIQKDPIARAEIIATIEQSQQDARLQAKVKKGEARALWVATVPADGTPAETYLRARGITGPIAGTIRYAPASNRMNHMLVAGAGRAVEDGDGGLTIDPLELTGVIRILLTLDGTGKATVSKPKLTMGKLFGSPIRLRPVNDGLTLAICEGVEDALSLSAPLGVGGWAVGGASFLEAAARVVPAYVETVILGEDNNDAGRTGCDKAEAAIMARTDWVSGRPPEIRRVRTWEGGAS